MSAEPRTEEGPFRTSADRVRQEFERWLEAAWNQGERAIDAIGLRPGRPAVDVVERPDSVLVLVDVPGLGPEQLDVSLAGNMLTIQGAFPDSPAAEADQVHLRERPTGSFKRSVPLPASVDPESISAECRLGVLQVTIAKSERDKARRITIRCASAGASTSPA
jgi:HSP20 family protein